MLLCQNTPPLRGIQIGVIYDPQQQVNTHKMIAFKRALKVLQSNGAKIVDNAQLPGLEEYSNLPAELKHLVLETDFKTSMEGYLRSLKANPNQLKDLNDLMKAIKNDSREQFPERNIAIMAAASKTSPQDPNYSLMLTKEEYFGHAGGIKGALDTSKCRVLISPSGSLTLQKFAAMGGNPAVSVPMGVYPMGTEIEHDKADGLVTVAPGIP